MPKNNIIVITVEENPEFTLAELCRVCNVAPEFVSDMIEYGVIEEPEGLSSEEWRFTSDDLRRMRIAARLYRDLEINMAGAALVLDLMEEMERMRAQIELLDKHLKF